MILEPSIVAGHRGVVDVGIASTGARLEADVRHLVDPWNFAYH